MEETLFLLMVATSPKGWTSNALGLWWLQNHFEPATKPSDNGYRFLVLDGHGSHVTPEFQDFCSNHKIQLLCLPRHTSHMLQPLDVAVFSSLKHYFRRVTERRLRAGATRFPKTEFLQTYHQVWLQAITEINVKSGFRKAGLVPFNPENALKRLPAPPTSPTPQPAELNSIQLLRTSQNQEDLNKIKKISR